LTERKHNVTKLKKQIWYYIKIYQVSKQGRFIGTLLVRLAESILLVLLGVKGLVLPGSKGKGLVLPGSKGKRFIKKEIVLF